MEFIDLLSQVSEKGFAVMISLILLFRFEKRMEDLTGAINNLMMSFEKKRD